MPDLCLITTCMGRLAHLQQTLPAAVSQPGCTCIVVDYSCPERSGDWIERTYPQVQVVRVPGQKYFNASRARNAGASQATAPWLCFFDADGLLAPEFAARMVPVLRQGHYYTVDVSANAPNLVGTAICHRADFLELGGYDEVIEGWGGEDRDLYGRLHLRGVQRGVLPTELVTALPHEDSQRVEHYEIKSTQISQTLNLLYRNAKLDLMRLINRDLSREEREHLYGEAKRVLEAWLRDRRGTEWRVTFFKRQTPLGPGMASTLLYSLHPLMVPSLNDMAEAQPLASLSDKASDG